MSALPDIGANISVILEKVFWSLFLMHHLFNICMHVLTSASRANLGAIGQCDLTFR